MSKIKIHLSAAWERFGSAGSDELMIKGTAYLGDQRQDAAGLAAELPGNFDDTKALHDFNARYNGFYALVAGRGKHLVAAVDRVRSLPLFYGQAGGRFFLSDDAEWVRQQVGDREIDPVAREEFQLAGYVTGQETLFPNVKQLQAGEFLVAAEDDTKVTIHCHRYYRFLHSEPSQYDEPSLRKQLDQAAVRSVQRLIDYAADRQIVVPLSGGYDSRLIATLLARLGYGNVLTFSYGTQGNKESRYSKQVADALGLEWRFVAYTGALWREAWETEERWAYQKWASGWSSIAHVQDWLAVKLMKEAGTIQPDCIFVPGHTGDFISGGHIPISAVPNQHATRSELARAVLAKHYCLAPRQVVSTATEREWQERVLVRAEQEKVERGEDIANGSEKWEWQERQAKFICNSVRVYEFFGYDWWLPLWDMEFMEFWQNVPLALRKGREWYVAYVARLYAEQAGTDCVTSLKNAADSPLKESLKALPIFRSALLRDAIRLIRGKSGITIRRGILSSNGRYPHSEYRRLVRQGFSTNGIAANFFLRNAANAELG